MGDLLPAFKIKKKSLGTKHHDVSQSVHRYMCVFCAEKCLDSQFWSGNDQNIQSLLETMINTETLLQHKQPTVIPLCCSHRFYPPAEREEENNPELVFTV